VIWKGAVGLSPKKAFFSKNDPYQWTRHHTVPRCICNRVGLAPNFEGNIILTQRYKHEAWHLLFGVDLPWRVSDYLRGGRFSLDTLKKRRAYRLVFGTKSFEEAAQIVDREWIGLYGLEIETLEEIISSVLEESDDLEEVGTF